MTTKPPAPKPRRLAWCGLLAAVTLAACSTTVPVAVPPTAPALYDVPYSEVTALPVRDEDRRLAYGEDRLQFALGWLPPDEPRALVVFVHGGCWLSDYDVEHVRAATAALAEAGFEAWALEYRRSGDEGGGWPGSFDDIVTGVRTLHDESADLPLVLLGHSAGGHLALLAAARLTEEVESVVGLAAITDVTAYALGDNGCQRATAGFFGGLPGEQAEAYRQATVVATNLRERALLLQGTADSIVPVSQASVEGLEARQLDGVGHFDWVHPQSHAFTELLEWLGERVPAKP